MNTKLLLLHALSPLHAGTGQGVGVIDQPIAREKATNIPYLPGSSIKGIFRDEYKKTGKTDKEVDELFGSAIEGGGKGAASSINFSDARLLLLPVRSIAGVFAWVTSPFMLQRLKRDVHEIPFKDNPSPKTIPQVETDGCLICEDASPLVIVESKQVIIEDLPLTPDFSVELKEWGTWLQDVLFPDDPTWQGFLLERLCLVSDDVFSFLLEIGTEVNARISIDDETKTSSNQALWYEEALPAETVLTSLAVTSNIKVQPQDAYQIIQDLSGKSLQFGGSATIGQGVCQARLIPEVITT